MTVLTRARFLDQTGKALRCNTGLHELDLTHNAVGEKGTMVLADAIVENKTLRQCQLDENPVGAWPGTLFPRGSSTAPAR